MVSEQATQYIRNFLSACVAYVVVDDDDDDSPPGKGDKAIIPASIPMSVNQIHEAIKNMVRPGDEGDGATKLSSKILQSLQLGAKLWGAAQQGSATRGPVDKTWVRQASTDDAAAMAEDSNLPQPPHKGHVALYQRMSVVAFERWQKKLRAEGERKAKVPTPDQWRVIEFIHDRCMAEQREWNSESQKKSIEEPLRLMIHGLPGAGKSQVIHWVRSFFEEVLGWKHGREFVCIASMNTMAALIGGLTIHAFGEVPFDEVQGMKKRTQQREQPGVNSMYSKCENLRWILIDEGSSASCENLSWTETGVRNATRHAAETYKVRPKKGGCTTEERPWGGLNILFFTDWWQLGPVRQTAISSNPFLCNSGPNQRIHNMFWHRDVDSMNKLVELTEAKRQKDLWFLAFIQQCRNGTQSWEMYLRERDGEPNGVRNITGRTRGRGNE